jgi:nucleotide-binding universal stress UspA family protein
LRRIGDRQFLYAWQLIRADTLPDPEAMRWRIGDVQCHRYRYSHMAPEHSITLDVCHLQQSGADTGWHVMVAAETWWDDRRTVVRTNCGHHMWRGPVSGRCLVFGPRCDHRFPELIPGLTAPAPLWWHSSRRSIMTSSSICRTSEPMVMTSVILSIVDRPDSAPNVLAAAGCFGSLMGGARINVLAVRVPPDATIMPTEEVMTRSHEARIRASEQVRIVALKAVYEAWAETAPPGISPNWFDVEGLEDGLAAEWGRRADTIVLKRPGGRDQVVDRQTIHAALFETDRPVLLVPPAHTGVFGRRVAIAWRDDKRAIRAVLAGLRCLAQAERVFVLAGVREGATPPGFPEILREHGIDAELHVLPIAPGGFGETLLRRTHELGADMLVCGAFYHTPVRELIVGGVTRYLLERADLPVLLRH